MVELEGRTSDPAIERWLDATKEVLQAGVTGKDLDDLLTAAIEDHTQQTHLPDCSENGVDTVYTKLPPGLITVPDAAKKYGINRRTIQAWLRQSKLDKKGRLRGSARGGGYVLMSEEELVHYMNTPRPLGRPPKTISTD